MVLKVFFEVIAIVTGCLAVLVSIFLLFHFRWASGGPVVWVLKTLSGALAPFCVLAGLFCIGLGIIVSSGAIISIGVYSFLVYAIYIFRITSRGIRVGDFERAFGKKCMARIRPEQRTKLLQSRFGMSLPEPPSVEPMRDLAFCTIAGTDRQLLCDVWLPQNPSGLALIYFHGSAWTVLDKDVGTRPFFRHLASQGHLIMDVAYRLYPETDMTGMIQDVKRAIAWLKSNASTFQINPDRIVLGGGSAGGHLAMMAAYLPKEIKLAPQEFPDADLSVHAVVSLYGPPDLEALYFHTGQDVTTKSNSDKTKQETVNPPAWQKKIFGKDYHRLGMDKSSADMGALRSILGCHPEECPEIYRYFSPVAHAKKGCPPTLMIQGEHDMFTPADAARHLHNTLTAAGAVSLLHILPQTDHAFDLFLPKVSPPARIAFYEIDRFLALVL